MRKKTIIGMLLLLAISTGMVGCGSTDEKNVSDNKENQTENIPKEETQTEETQTEDVKKESDYVLDSGLLLQNPYGTTEYNITSKEVPFYEVSELYGNLPVYIINDVKDIAYIDMDTLAWFMGEISSIKLEKSVGNHYVTFTRTDSYSMTLDFEKDIAYFNDYDAFISLPGSGTILNVLISDADSSLFNRLDKSYERYGATISIPFGDYGIDFIEKDGGFYIPLQTVNDLLIYNTGFQLYYNGENLIVTQEAMLSIEGSESNELYFKKDMDKRSKELILYNYAELCLMMDYFYGLKEEHNISNFNDFFFETGLASKLLSEDAKETSDGIKELTYRYLSDRHSGMRLNSAYAGYGMPSLTADDLGISLYNDKIITLPMYQEAQKQYYPDGIPGYEEVGDTAYITFDAFACDSSRDYYTNPGNEGENDTIALIQYANRMIKRENSPIKNVVLDLSTNGGGDASAAVYTLSWFLGEAFVNINNPLTGAEVSEAFSADINLDKEYNSEDSLEGYNLYCLISPYSFSCGNLVPAVFKNSGRVTLLGKKSAGGSCVVSNRTTADGNSFCISGTTRLNVLYNGTFYQIDQGVVPDFTIDKASNFYNREKLTEYIHSLF